MDNISFKNALVKFENMCYNLKEGEANELINLILKDPDRELLVSLIQFAQNDLRSDNYEPETESEYTDVEYEDCDDDEVYETGE